MLDGLTSRCTKPIRCAACSAEAICSIYNQGIAGRQATFETRPREPGEVAAWFDDGLPLLVAADADGHVLGWARVGAYSDRCVYEGVCEHAVYVATDAQGRGVGRALLDALDGPGWVAAHVLLHAAHTRWPATDPVFHQGAGYDFRGMTLTRPTIGRPLPDPARRPAGGT